MKGKSLHFGDRGLSLTEILVGVAVIAILGALLFPFYSKTIAAAQSTKCMSNLKGMGAGALRYFSEHNGELIPGRYWFYPSDTPVHVEGNIMRGILEYLMEGTENRPVIEEDTVLTCPTIKAQYPRMFPSHCNRTYSINRFAHAYGPGEQMITQPQARAFPGTIYNIRKQSAMWLFMDGPIAPENFVFTYADVNMPYMPHPHQQHSNAVFFDGHVERVAPERISLPASDDFWGGPSAESP